MTLPRAMAPTERVARALAPLGQWRLVRALPGGSASDSWLVDAQGRRLVVRADRPLARTLGLDRAAEWEVLRAVSAACLGPAPVLRDPGKGVLVTEFLPGTVWTGDALRCDSKLTALGCRLRELHALPASGPAFDPVRIAERYARAAGAGHAERLRSVRRLATDLYGAGARRSICHHDPHAGNVVAARDGSLRFIDWEYAAVGDPLFDLAVVARYHGLSTRQAQVLLDAWNGGHEPLLAERFDAMCRLYETLTDLWEAAVGPS